MQFNYQQFITSVAMSRVPHILLEGPDDKAFFKRMCKPTVSNPSHHDINITTAEQIRSEGPAIGNRRKVEEVSDLVSGKPFRFRFLGFVDREFREFAVGTSVSDLLQSHHCRGRLVWSRGHSIENYMFDFEIFEQTLRGFSPNDEIAMRSLAVLRDQFADVIRIACALGLVALEQCSLKIVRRTVNWQTLQFVDGKLELDVTKWNDALENQSNLNSSVRGQLARGFRRCLEITKLSASEDVRWACDGHIGFKLIWAAYARLVNDIASDTPGVEPNPPNQRRTVLSANERVRFNHAAQKWVESKATNNNSPMFCLDLIGAS